VQGNLLVQELLALAQVGALLHLDPFRQQAAAEEQQQMFLYLLGQLQTVDQAAAAAVHPALAYLVQVIHLQ